MAVAHYRKQIARQLETGELLVPCGCGEMAVDYTIGSPVCASCKEKDKVYVNSYVRHESEERKLDEYS